MTLSRIKPYLRRFSRDTDGYITVEAMIVLPALFLIFAACWVYFDVMRQQTVNQTANYAIGDMLSRETDEIDDTYIDNTYKLLLLMTKSEGAYTEEGAGLSTEDLYETDMRITVVSYNENNGKYTVEWSAARGDYPELTTKDLTEYTERLPILGNDAELILVETWDDYSPVFRVGLDAFEIKTYSFTHPRYTPQLVWAGENNGWGNGDQDAPGNSLCNNNAENATDCTNEDGANNIEPTGA